MARIFIDSISNRNKTETVNEQQHEIKKHTQIKEKYNKKIQTNGLIKIT